MGRRSKKYFAAIVCVACLLASYTYMYNSLQHVHLSLNYGISWKNFVKIFNHLDNGILKKHSFCKSHLYESTGGVFQDISYNNDNIRAEIARIHMQRENETYHGQNCSRKVPSCLIIGVAKAGTDEIRDFMRLHPDIAAADKEIYYFSRNMRQGVEWYMKQMPCSYDGQITVEKTPDYFPNHDVAKRVYGFLKSMKFILIVRNPIDRIVSALNYFNFPKNVQGTEVSLNSMPNFDRIVTDPTGKVNEHMEVSNSLYANHLTEYLKFFNLSQILVLDAEELKSDPVKSVQRVETFLGLPHKICHDMFVFVPEKRHFCLRSNGTWCYSANRGRTVKKDISNGTRDKLRAFFKPHNERFFKLVGKKFDW